MINKIKLPAESKADSAGVHIAYGPAIANIAKQGGYAVFCGNSDASALVKYKLKPCTPDAISVLDLAYKLESVAEGCTVEHGSNALVATVLGPAQNNVYLFKVSILNQSVLELPLYRTDRGWLEFFYLHGLSKPKAESVSFKTLSTNSECEPSPKFKLGDKVRKTKGSQWHGTIVGTYSTTLTPEGYAVESSTEHGSVQIYPAAALELDRKS